MGEHEVSIRIGTLLWQRAGLTEAERTELHRLLMIIKMCKQEKPREDEGYETKLHKIA